MRCETHEKLYEGCKIQKYHGGLRKESIRTLNSTACRKRWPLLDVAVRPSPRMRCHFDGLRPSYIQNTSTFC